MLREHLLFYLKGFLGLKISLKVTLRRWERCEGRII
jgi:hypothetical protein